MTGKLSERSYGIDLLKCIAIFGVLVIHSCFYGYEVTSPTFISYVFWGSVVRASVPIFFLCSGALFLSAEKPISMKKLFTKNIPRILVAMVFWGMAYKVFHLLAAGGLTLPALFTAFKEVLVFNQEFHLYYLQIILLVYLFLPITGLIVQHATKKQLQYLLLLWFAFGIVYPTVSSFWPFNLLGMMAPQFKINMTYAAIGYGLLGYYLKQYPFKRRAGALSALAGFGIVFGGTMFMSIRSGALHQLFLEGMTVGVCLLAAGIFILCVHAQAPKRAWIAGAVTYGSKASFCVFLVHVFFNEIFRSRGLSAASFPIGIGAPLAALVLLVCSLVVYAVLSHIPVVKKWLV